MKIDFSPNNTFQRSFAAIAIGGAAVGLAGGVGKMIGRGKANKQMEALIAQNPVYKENPMARQRLGLAQSLLNARMPGAAAAERNIYGTQANRLSQLQRGATDSSQLLAMGAQAQGQTNQAFGDLGIAEAQDYQRRYGNLAGAQEGVIREGDKVFQDETRRFQDLAQIRGAQNANRQANWGDVSGMGFGLMDFGMTGLSGGFGDFLSKDNATTDRGIPSNPWSGSQGRKIDYGLINSSYPKFG